MAPTRALLLTSGLLVACGGGVPAELTVAGLEDVSAQSQALRVADLADVERPRSQLPGFGFAEVDGLRIEVLELGLQELSGARHSVSIGEEIDIQPGVQRIWFSQAVSLPPGDYRSAKLEFDAAYTIQAHCRTPDHLVYTTATDVRRLDCAVEDCDGPLPADYDYYRYEFIYVTTDDGPFATGDRDQEETLEPFSVHVTGSPRLAILVDTSYLASCYDGSVGVGQGQGLAPFSYHPSDAEDSSAFFPVGVPAFGIGYVPLFISVSDDPQGPLPVGETYAAAPERGMLEGAVDPGAVLVTTFAFEPDGSILAARARNFDRANVDLNQYFSGFSRDDEGRFRFYNGEFYWTEEQPGRYLQDREVVGFERLELDSAPLESHIGDGPECGTQRITEHGNQARECLFAPSSVWWKRIPRL